MIDKINVVENNNIFTEFGKQWLASFSNALSFHYPV